MNLERKMCSGKKETIISTTGSTVIALHCSSLLPDLSIFFSDPKNNFITSSKGPLALYSEAKLPVSLKVNERQIFLML